MGAEQQKQMPQVPEKTMKCKVFITQNKLKSTQRKFKLLDVNTLDKKINFSIKARLFKET